ncbi:hypothetical protein FNO01nite_14290 [Flavobacterium noncentrifugens]|uniref:Uncharacterized protein n=1 Tax=Flavobacterium noncentrifugens TaxID=1128970 RepID=A0A1G8W3A2_9FLAO|nr:hypothetical protein [Flavobacterium noncentrifugens]GEP50757.1 hypothetical protein FNO01nite_14290 [Flavobacterium noncentrifugens]SDJ72851.1 hypothetical protein SAMN04487935_1635 [Flavobacterium noncentrifugens]
MKTLSVPGFYESENFYANLRTVQTDFRIADLINFSEESLGFALAEFLQQHHFSKDPILEKRDIFHVLTNTGISARAQIGLQFYLIGNGKKSITTCLAAILGSMFYLHSLPFFFKKYKKGKNALLFHSLEFTKMLNQPLSKIRETFLIR